jgi:hypothetical protein
MINLNNVNSVNLTLFSHRIDIDSTVSPPLEARHTESCALSVDKCSVMGMLKRTNRLRKAEKLMGCDCTITDPSESLLYTDMLYPVSSIQRTMLSTYDC